jgi:hypothetical protein
LIALSLELVKLLTSYGLGLTRFFARLLARSLVRLWRGHFNHGMSG